MCKKYVVLLLMINIFLGLLAIPEENKKEVEMRWEQERIVRECKTISGHVPVIDVQSIQRTENSVIEEDKYLLYKIVEAEAGGEDRIGKILVANVILNRLEDESFPDTIREIVYQQKEGVTQFSPVADGSLEAAKPKEDTIEAVDAALQGEDYSQGALYFMARKYAEPESVTWFDTALLKVLEYGGHEFYK